MFASLIVFRVIFCAVRGSGSMLRQGMFGCSVSGDNLPD